MKRSLYWKLTLSFLLVAFITAGLVMVFTRITNANRLFELIIDQQQSSMEQAAGNYYTLHGSWDSIEQNWGTLMRSASVTPMPPANNNNHMQQFNPRGDWERPNFFGLADANGIVLISSYPNMLPGQKLGVAQISSGTAITVNGTRVGTLLRSRGASGFNPAESLFLRRTNEGLIYATLGALVVALLMGAILARTLTRPLLELTRAAQNIARGQLEQQVQVRSSDEIGQLASAFNTMSQEVARSNQLRRQMTADIAHDLRTPLTVIAGYIESIRDGILKPTQQRLALIYSEIERLLHMVGDLRMLTQADAGELRLNPQNIQPKALLERVADVFRHPASLQQVTLDVDASDNLPEIRIDEARMMQVMDNLLSNALRYTPPEGKITLSARATEHSVILSVQDTGTGILAEELPLIFNRFHRGDKSRHIESDESGLGLAIVKALVDAHGGKVWAESVPEQGTVIHIELQLASDGVVAE
jgi:signal transduction histidine kinase